MRRSIFLLHSLAFTLLLFTLLASSTHAQSTSNSSTADAGNSTATGSSTGSSTAAGNTSSSSTGPASPPARVPMTFSEFRCGTQYVGEVNGVYYNGVAWDFNQTDYLDLVNEFTGTRSEPQMCYGSGRGKNCLDQWVGGTWPEGSLARNGRQFCAPWNFQHKFVRGEVSPPICIVFSGGFGGSRMFKMMFYPKVDQFALLQIRNSSSNLTYFGHIGSAFQVELNGIQSDIKHRYGFVTSSEFIQTNGSDNSGKFGGTVCTVVPFWTVNIKLKQGAVQSIEFDDDCSLCRNDYCVDGNCATDVSTCASIPVQTSRGSTFNSQQTNDCDFKIYVSWSGTDAEGTYLSSSQRRLSQFRRWSLSAVYNQASSFNVGELPIAPPDQSLGG